MSSFPGVLDPKGLEALEEAPLVVLVHLIFELLDVPLKELVFDISTISPTILSYTSNVSAEVGCYVCYS